MPNTTGPQVIIDIPSEIAVGIATEFSVSFKAGNMGGTMVVGEGQFPEGDFTAQYYENGAWKDFPQGSNTFGPASGFPLQDATSYFRVTFNSAMTGTFVVRMKSVSTGEYIAMDEARVMAVVGETIDELNARIALGGAVRLNTDVKGTISIANDVTIDGQGHTLHGNIVLDSSSSTAQYNVTVADLTMREDGGSTSAKGYGIIGQNQSADSPVRPVNLVVRNCNIQSYDKKGVYLTNSKTFNMTGCTIGNVATLPMNTPNTYGDYAIDLNLCGVQNCAVRIVDNKFTGSCGNIGAVKVTQRGGVGLTDDVNTDILNTTSATIASCLVQGNDFSEMNASKAEGVADVVMGSAPNSDGTPRTYNNSYPMSVTASGETYFMVRGGKDADVTLTMPSGATASVSSQPVAGTKTYTKTVDATAGVTYTGTIGSEMTLAIDVGWKYPDGGAVGAGFNGLRRLIMRVDSLTYTAGGIEFPEWFEPVAVIEASAEGGVMSYLDMANRKLVLYTANGVEASGTLTDVTIVMVGH